MQPAAGEARTLVFDSTAIRAYVASVFTGNGWTRREASITADNLVLADLSGHASHGIGLLPLYVETMKAGRLSPASKPKVIKDDPPFLVIDGRRSMGQVGALDATERAISIARKHGVAIVNLVDSHHVGRIGHYGEMAAAAGLLGLFWVNVHGRPPTVVPFAAREPRFSTNPHCVAIPRKNGRPFLLDFATAEVAFNKARVAWAQGKTLRHGALVDHLGLPTDDPSVLFKQPRGSIAAFGLHKGSGMALVCELLSSALGGGPQVSDGEDAGAILNNMLAIVIDPARMATRERSFAGAADALVDWVKSALPAEGIDEVLVPGEPEWRERDRLGPTLEIDATSWRLVVAAAELGGVPRSCAPAVIA